MKKNKYTTKTAILFATTVATLTTNAALAQFAFDADVTYATGQRPEGIAAGDFNGDGIIDLGVVTDPQNTNGLERIEILNGVGDGTFTAGLIISLPNSSSPGELAAADFDGDGDDDFLVILEDFNQVMTITNTGSTFTLGATASVGADARGMDLGDLDNDGDIDATVANRDSNTATVLTNLGNGTFTSTTLTAGAEPRAATFLDIDDDGDLDLAVSNHDSRSVSLFTNAAGNFTASGTLNIPSPFRPEGLTAADLNNDGFDDLAIAAEGAGVNVARIYLNQSGTFTTAQQYNTNGIDSSTIIAADLNCDESPDLVTLNDDSANVSLLENVGNGAFATGQTMSVASEPSQATTADFDADGDLDIAVTNKLANSVSVLMNQTCAAAQPVVWQSVTFTFGSLLSGDVGSILIADNVYLRGQSQFGFLSSEPNVAECVVVGMTGNLSPSTANLAIEARLNNPNGSIRLQLRDWTTGVRETIHSYTLGTVETRESVNIANAVPFVRATDGEVELAMKSVVVATFSLSGFQLSIDEIAMDIE